MFPFTNHFRILVFVRIVIILVENLFLLFCLNSKLWYGTLVTCDKHWITNRFWHWIEQMTRHLSVLIWIFHVYWNISLLGQAWHWVVPMTHLLNFKVHYSLVLINFRYLLHQSLQTLIFFRRLKHFLKNHFFIVFLYLFGFNNFFWGFGSLSFSILNKMLETFFFIF